MWDVGIYLLEKYKKKITTARTLCFISPCHPFRTSEHLCSAYELYKKKKALSLVSITEYPCPPELAVDVNGGWVQRKWSGLIRKDEFPSNYYPNGAITFVDRDIFFKHKHAFSKKTIGYEMSWPDCLDIDYNEDYILAQKIADML